MCNIFYNFLTLPPTLTMNQWDSKKTITHKKTLLQRRVKIGAGDGIRTHDINLGNIKIYCFIMLSLISKLYIWPKNQHINIDFNYICIYFIAIN